MRVVSYEYLLTDKYPPFSWDDADYPVRLMAQPGRLNRLAVLFRLILMIPAYLVFILASYGVSTIVIFVTWFIVLVAGRMPRALHEALAAVVRYQIRFNGYCLMVTSEYPWGLFGDQPILTPASAISEPGGSDLSTESGQPLGGVPALSPSWSPADDPRWQLVLSRSAKRLVGLFLVLGVLIAGTYVVFVVPTIENVVNRETMIIRLEIAHTAVKIEVTAYDDQLVSCQHSTMPASCIRAADENAAQALGTFRSTVKGISMPAAAVPAADQVVSVAFDAEQDLQRLEASAGASQGQQANLRATTLTPDLIKLDQRVQSLVSILNHPTSATAASAPRSRL